MQADACATQRMSEERGVASPVRVPLRVFLEELIEPSEAGEAHARQVEMLRTLKEGGDHEAARRLKKGLICVRPSGLFDTREGERLLLHSGWLQVDLDAADNPELLEDPEDAKERLAAFEEVAFAARSVTDGVWGLVRLSTGEATTADEHRAFFDRMAHAFAAHGVHVDASCRNPGRMRFYAPDARAIVKEPWRVTPLELPGERPRSVTDRVMEEHERKGRSREAPAGTVARAREVLEEQGYVFVKGGRHDFLFELACLCNRWGIPEDDVRAYVDAHLVSLSEVKSNCLEDPYRRYAGQFGGRS